MERFAPPYPNDDAFFCRFFTEVSSLRDAAGRPLHEVDFREQGDAYVRCPFHDSRRGYLMNRAALTQITGEWSEILSGIRFYSSLFHGAPDFARAWRISLSTMFAPLYLVHRAKAPYADGALPTPISGVFKIMLDVPTTMDLMVIDRRADGILHEIGSHLPAEIQRYADSTSILLNGEYACAGAPGLIENTLGILFADIPPGDSRSGVFAEAFAEEEEFLAFCYLMSTQYVAGLLYLFSTMLAMERAFSQLGAAHGAPDGERLSAYERRRRIALEALTTSPPARSALLRRFASLVADEGCWRGSSADRLGLESLLDDSALFIGRLEGASPSAIVSAHQAYQQTVEQTLRLLQRKIADCIGATQMFSPAIRFGNPALNPVEILRRMLGDRPTGTPPPS